MKTVLLIITFLLVGSEYTHTYGGTMVASRYQRIKLKEKQVTKKRSIPILPIYAYLCDEAIEITFSKSLPDVTVTISSDVLPVVYENQLNDVCEHQQLDIPINNLEPGIYHIEFNIKNAPNISGEFIIEETLSFN